MYDGVCNAGPVKEQKKYRAKTSDYGGCLVDTKQNITRITPVMVVPTAAVTENAV